MSNLNKTTHAALLKNIKRTNELVIQMSAMLESFELSGKEDTTALKANIQKMKGLIADHEKTIRETPE